jgi:hypothetical protein
MPEKKVPKISEEQKPVPTMEELERDFGPERMSFLSEMSSPEPPAEETKEAEGADLPIGFGRD